jgi:hypothetical protein
VADDGHQERLVLFVPHFGNSSLKIYYLYSIHQLPIRWFSMLINAPCRTSVFMTLWRTHTLIHDITTKYPKPAELTIWLVIQKV